MVGGTVTPGRDAPAKKELNVSPAIMIGRMSAV